MSAQKIKVYTIGHSTRALQDFIALLKQYCINELVDVRTIARSRHNPQYNQENLAHALQDHHIGYRHEKKLGGLRRPVKGSINTAWRNSSFRGYADYMQTEEFANAVETLLEIAKNKQVAIMCAEAVPWRCHRSLIADALLVRGIKVEDILSMTSSKEHTLTPWAVVKGTTITYPNSRAQPQA